MNATAVHQGAAAEAPPRRAGAWPLERILFLLAGSATGLSALLAALVSPWFLLLTGFVALNQLAFASVRHCGASLVLEHLFGARRCANS
jgi:Inner membrane protein YgaP-like, transmembrane domain